jgi:hypothetical protein
MVCINSFESAPPPSWSWMRLAGGIDYFMPTGDQYTWNTVDISPVWEVDHGTNTDAEHQGTPAIPSPPHPEEQAAATVPVLPRSYIMAMSRQIDLKKVRQEDHLLVYDVVDGLEKSGEKEMEACSEAQILEFVVVAEAKDGRTKDRKFILIVEPGSFPPDSDNRMIYHRIGVGYVSCSVVDMKESGIPVRIY